MRSQFGQKRGFDWKALFQLIGTVIGVILVVALVILIMYCNYQTASADYRPAIIEDLKARYPGHQYQLLDSEFEEDDGDVEIDVRVTKPNGRSFEVEYDCTCECFGEGVNVRFDGVQ